jgi:uroporphyrinogen-III decarboxylase
MDKTQQILEKWCAAEGINFKDKKAEEEYKKRAKRLAAAIQLTRADRLPVNVSWGVFPALRYGYTIAEVSEDFNKALDCGMKTLKEYQPDCGMPFIGINPFFHSLGYKPLRLPGIDLPATSNFQFVEGEYVTADEFYDHFLDDPTDFWLRTYLPKVCTILEPLKKLRPIRDNISYSMGMPAGILQFSDPEIAGALKKLLEVSEEVKESNKLMVKFSNESITSGFPSLGGGFSQAPFDVIGDYIRGTKGIMLDMYRRPEKLLAALDKLVPYILAAALEAKKNGRPCVNMPLHKHADNFMSKEQFKTFFWPSLRKVMMGLIDEGLVPMPFFEGQNTSRLDVINDIPKGKAVYIFQDVDIHKFREICGSTVCFSGNVPISLLCTGTADQVKAYLKELIDVVGKDGGLIVNASANVENAKPENVKVLLDFAKEYGTFK